MTAQVPSRFRFDQLIASRGFQKWAAAFPLTRRLVRKEGEALFDLVAGFCHSQILLALVQLEIPETLIDGPQTLDALSFQTGVPRDRMLVLAKGGAALGLLKIRRDGRIKLARKGAALVGVPGLAQMIRHHDVLYRDLADPVAFFRGETETELADFWPYVFGASGATDPETTAIYSDLMTQSQTLVAEDTLRAVSFCGVKTLLDIGGGTGAFLTAVGQAVDRPELWLFDLPAVVPDATQRFANSGLSHRTKIHPGSFRDDPLPFGADMISLIRILYDHADETVGQLLRSAFDALPSGGQLLISEPMSGGDVPTRAGDAYFALYTMAMRTGKTRSAAEITALCADAGFARINAPRAPRPFITQAIIAQKP